ncbi:MAG: hypothetical protein KAI79_06345 [Bacteroidales bacterium]|nr:hypothetical protein [Bacteroidales bacterium]
MFEKLYSNAERLKFCHEFFRAITKTFDLLHPTFEVFVLLSIEEINAYANASSVYYKYDIIAGAVGFSLAIISFELFFRKKY